MKHSFLLLLILFLATMVLTACSFSPPTQNLASPSPSPIVLSVDEIRTLMTEGAQAREAGDYSTGEQKLSVAFAAALNGDDPALAIETGNNLSIQYRLSAGRANRQNQLETAHRFSQESLNVYDQLRAKGWLDENDPGLARNWAHALLYAGRIDDAIPALEKSLKLQTAPAAQGDESNHLAAAFLAQGNIDQASQLLAKGVPLVEKNNGSPIWLTFGLMTRASVLSQQGDNAAADIALSRAATIAEENQLIIRQEEIAFMESQPADGRDVLVAVGTPE